MMEERKHRLQAFVASCAFHGLVLSAIVLLAIFYHAKILSKNGSAAGIPSITLEKMTVTSPPAPTPIQQHLKPVLSPPVLAPNVVTLAQPQKSESKPAPTQGAVPILALQPAKPNPATEHHALPKIQPVPHPASATALTQIKPAAAKSISSYSPGPSVLPHPPYPLEARDRNETGVVVMNVQFNVEGDVAHADVAQSSGVPILDDSTRSFVLAHWHSPAYAGQVVSVPVEYTLQNL
jgi:TonB family protein